MVGHESGERDSGARWGQVRWRYWQAFGPGGRFASAKRGASWGSGANLERVRCRAHLELSAGKAVVGEGWGPFRPSGSPTIG